jgi:hypothetical protein
MNARFDKYIQELEGLLARLCAAEPLSLLEAVSKGG